MSEPASILRSVLAHAKDVVPLVAVVVFFQAVVLRQPVSGLSALLPDLLLLVLGVGIFMRGLHLALFPAGEGIGRALVRRGSPGWLFAFSFLIGSGTAMAEPGLTTVAGQVADAVIEAGWIADTPAAAGSYALGYRLCVALGVGTALVLGAVRTVKGWPLHRLLAGALIAVALALPFAPPEFAAVAFDSGGVTLSTITVPLVTALGIGLASSIGGRNPLTDGFGLVALAATFPSLFVLAYGALTKALA